MKSFLINKYLKMKQNLYFRKNHIYVAKGSKIDFRTKIGKHTRINHASHIDYCEIGSYCAIAGRLIVRSQDHFTCYLNMQADFQKNILQSEISVTGKSDSKVKIGNAVWIGDSVIILKNVSIGNGAVIGAGSVVTKPIPAYAIAAGNPAKVLKFRFSTEICQIIESTKWWLWDIPKIIENRELFELDLTKENIEATKDFFKDIGRN